MCLGQFLTLFQAVLSGLCGSYVVRLRGTWYLLCYIGHYGFLCAIRDETRAPPGRRGDPGGTLALGLGEAHIRPTFQGTDYGKAVIGIAIGYCMLIAHVSAVLT